MNYKETLDKVSGYEQRIATLKSDIMALNRAKAVLDIELADSRSKYEIELTARN